MDATIAVTHSRPGDLLHPLLQVGLIRAAPTIVVARPLRPEHSTGSPDTDLPCAPDGVDQLPTPVKPQSFRKTTWTCLGKVESSLEVKGELNDEAATVHEGV